MNKEDITKNWYIETLVTDILYADLEAGNVDFLRMAYDKLGLNSKRITEMRTMCPKISSKAVNTVYEDIIGIITEELYQNGNMGLFMDLVDYYLQRFPHMTEEFDECEHDVEKWLWDARWIQESERDNFVRRSFILLYCYTYGDDDVILDLIFNWALDSDDHYPRVEYCAYDHKHMTEDSGNWVEEAFHINDFKNSKMFKQFVEIQKGVLTDFCGIAEDIYCFDDFFVLAFTELESMDGFADRDLQALFVLERWNAICRKYHMNQLIVFKAGIQVYLDMFKEIFEQMCMKEIMFLCHLNDDLDDEVLDIKLLEKVCMTEIINPEAFLTELILTFGFECFLISQKELYDEYYENFSFSNSETDMEKPCKENNRLKDELEQCKKKLQQYADADAEKRKQQNKEAKKENRQYYEKIASLEKQLDEQKKALEKQTRTMEDMKEYIALIESANNIKPDSEMVDISKIYQHRILFVGGRKETVTRLKAVFSTANFVSNETMQVPQKIDHIVLMEENMNHALYYKYIGLAREKGIKVIYCNGTNIETITKQVACNL